MKFKILLIVLGAAGLFLGCATRRPPQIPSSPPAPLEGEILEEEVVTPEGGEQIVVEVTEEKEITPTTPEKGKDLSWDEIKQLGFQYEVKPGDSLSAIAQRYKVGTGLLVRLNDLGNPDLIRIGQKLVVIEGPFRILVDKSDKTLSLYLDHTFIRSYPIALGTKGSTPEGEFTVLRKLVNPPWTDPYNRIIVRADNPEYPLGTRWIEFKAPPGAYGIHGTRDEKDIGREVSFGCVRILHPQEEEIYDFVTLGCSVDITP